MLINLARAKIILSDPFIGPYIYVLCCADNMGLHGTGS